MTGQRGADVAVLYVHGDRDAADAVASSLEQAADRLAVATANVETALDRLADGGVDCLVTEQALPDSSGLELVREARERSPDTACILCTDIPLETIDTEAFSDVIAEYVSKDDPAFSEALVDLVEHNLAFRSQTAYPLPENEEARLAALDRFAANPEAVGGSVDRLTEVATELFDLNAAAVGIVDEREQRFLGCHGITLEPMDREDTICTYAILDADVTVIEDTREDPRFADNRGLEAAKIRFYASAPVRTPDGQAIGTFCVYDSEPRSFDDRDRELLHLLADEVMDQLVLRRRLRTESETDV